MSRASTAAGLLALAIFGIPGGPAPGEPLVLDGAVPADSVAAILARDTASSLTWIDSAPPTRRVATLLAAAAQRDTDVTLTVPDGAGRLRVAAPDRPVAGRRGALRVSVRAEPDMEVPVTVRRPGGGIDSVSIRTDPEGRGAVSVAVEPSRAGAASWSVDSPAGAAVAHAWVRPPSPVRVLVWGGTPDVESRYLVRALESAGMEVEVLQELGRGLALTSPEVSVPRSLTDLGPYDVVALLGSPGDSAEALALRWARERGGGLLLAAPLPPTSPLRPWAPGEAGPERVASEIVWTGPAEIVPLPGPEIPVRAGPVAGGGIPLARMGDEPVVHLAPLGRGRLVASGLESWPWVMKAGLVSEHRAFWESVMEWLAGGLVEEAILIGDQGLPGDRWEGRFEGTAPDRLRLTRPPREDGRPAPEEEVPVLHGPDGTAQVAFVPTEPGVHALRPVAGAGEDAAPAVGPAFGVVVPESGTSPDWTAAALRIGQAGGRIVSPGRAGDRVGSDDRAARSPHRPLLLSWVLFLVLGGLAVLGWTLRRVRGLR